MIDEFKTISDTIGEGYYTEKRSKFLAFAHHVTTVDEVKEIVPGTVRNITMPDIVVMHIC